MLGLDPWKALRLPALLAAVMLAADGFAQQRASVADPVAAAHAMPATASVSAGLRLEVVDGRGRPCAGATLLVVAGSHTIDPRRVRRVQREAEQRYPKDFRATQIAIFVGLGKRYVTDAGGVATVPTLAPRDAVLVMANGLRRIVRGREVDAASVRVVLRPVGPVHVRVVDHTGRPVRGIGVRLNHDRYEDDPLSAVARTDASGAAELAFEQLLTHPVRKLAVRAGIAARHPVQQLFVPGEAGLDAAKPIEVRLPAYGQVQMYIVDVAGKPLPGLARAALTVRGSGRRYVPVVEPDTKSPDAATFAFVAVGTHVDLECRHVGAVQPLTKRCAGPRHHRDTRIATLEVKRVTGMEELGGRVLGPSGAPLANTELQMLVVRERRIVRRRLVTRADGTIRSLVSASDFGRGLGVLYFLQVERKDQGEQRILAAGRVGFTELRRRRFELGEVRLGAPQLLMGGQVVDSQGRPLAGVSVSVDHRWLKGQQGSLTARAAGADELLQTRAVTDDDGRFRLYGVSPQDLFRELVVTRSGYALAKRPRLSIGVKDAKIRMVATASIAGNIAGIPGHSRLMGVRLRPKVGRLTFQPTRRWTKNGSFSIRGCMPGEYSLAFELRCGSVVRRFMLPGIRLREGQVCKDPRLQCSLSDYMHLVQVVVQDRNGRPIPGATVAIRETLPGGVMVDEARADGQGVCQLGLAPAGGELRVQCEGFVTRTVPGVKADVVVQLERARRVAIEVVGLPELRRDVSYRARALRVGPGGEAPPASGWRRLVRGKAVVFVGDAGRYLLEIAPVRRAAWGRGRLQLAFVVKDGGGAVPVRLEVGPKGAQALERSIARLRPSP